MPNPFERFVSATFDPDLAGVGAGARIDRVEVLLRHIDQSLHAMHGKLDHLYGRMEAMDQHVKKLSDAVNVLVAAVNTTTSTISQAMSNLSQAIDEEDSAAIDANTATIMNAVGSLNAANAGIAAAHKPVAAALGGQATPASTVVGDGSNTQTAADQASQSGITGGTIEGNKANDADAAKAAAGDPNA